MNTLHRRISILATAVGLVAGATSSLAQGIYPSPVSFGIFSAWQKNFHGNDLIPLPNDSTCCRTTFTPYGGAGFTLAAHLQMSLTPVLGWQARLGYSVLNGTMTAQDFIGNVVDAQDNATIPVHVEHRLEASLGTIFVEPAIRLSIPDVPVNLALGGQVGLLLTRSYSYDERLLDAGHVRFVGESDPRSRNIQRNDLPDAASLYLGGVAALSGDIVIDPSWTISPEVGYVLGFSNIRTTASWKVSSLRAGVTVRFTPRSEPIPIPIQDTQRVLPKTPDHARIRAVPFDAAGEKEKADFHMQEYLSTQSWPLVNAIFFDEGSDQFDSRYEKLAPGATSGFSINGIARPKRRLVEDLRELDIPPYYYHILNIIGQRMRQRPGSKITLVGYRTTHGLEGRDKGLMSSRIRRVKNYLRDAWGVPESSIQVDEKPAGSDRRLAQNGQVQHRPQVEQEMQRVDILTDDDALLAPVVITDTAREISPPFLRLSPDASLITGIARWRTQLFHHGRFRQDSGIGKPPPTLDIDLRGLDVVDNTPIDAMLTVYNSRGDSIQSDLSSVSVNVDTARRPQAEQGRYRVEYHMIPAFGFDDAAIDPRAQAMIESIRDGLSPLAEVQIIGYTDFIGDDKYNETLSQQRSNGSLSILGRGRSTGIGEKDVFDRARPEGRFYNRFVYVVVRTPIK